MSDDPVLCGARAGAFSCYLNPSHDGPHEDVDPLTLRCAVWPRGPRCESVRDHQRFADCPLDRCYLDAGHAGACCFEEPNERRPGRTIDRQAALVRSLPRVAAEIHSEIDRGRARAYKWRAWAERIVGPGPDEADPYLADEQLRGRLGGALSSALAERDDARREVCILVAQDYGPHELVVHAVRTWGEEAARSLWTTDHLREVIASERLGSSDVRTGDLAALLDMAAAVPAETLDEIVERWRSSR